MKFSPSILVLLASAMMLPSCLMHTKLDKDTDLIRFSPVIGEGTRAGEDYSYSEFPTNSNFRVWALTSSGEKFLDHAVCSFTQNGWTPIGDPIWPSGKSLRFIGYSPEQLSGMECDANGVMTLAGYTVDSVNDLLFTDLTHAQSYSDGGTVGLPFYHALSEVDFRVLNALGSDVSIKVKKISVASVYDSGSFNSSSDPQWTPSGEADEEIFYAGGDSGTVVSGTNAEYVGNPRLILPQDNREAICLVFSYSTDGLEWSTDETLYSVADLKEWAPDRHYTYTLSVRRDADSGIFVLRYTTGISSWAK